MSNKKILLKMQDGGIINIKHEMYSYGGCPTCGYGRYFSADYTIELENSKDIYISVENEDYCNEDEEYIFSVEDMMKIILWNVDEMSELYESELERYLLDKIKEYMKDIKEIDDYVINNIRIINGKEEDTYY